MADEIDDETWAQIQTEFASPAPPDLSPNTLQPVSNPATNTMSPIAPTILSADNSSKLPLLPSPRPRRLPRVVSSKISDPVVPAKRRREPSPFSDKGEGSSVDPSLPSQRRPPSSLRVMVPHSGPRPVDRLPPPSSSEKPKIVSTLSLLLFPMFSTFLFLVRSMRKLPSSCQMCLACRQAEV
jgi:hypothetical protein